MILGSTLAGLAGATLLIADGHLPAEPDPGAGFIAVALVYFGAWRPVGVMAGALLYGLTDAVDPLVEGARDHPAQRLRPRGDGACGDHRARAPDDRPALPAAGGSRQAVRAGRAEPGRPCGSTLRRSADTPIAVKTRASTIEAPPADHRWRCSSEGGRACHLLAPTAACSFPLSSCALLGASVALAGAATSSQSATPQLKVALIAPSAHNDLAFTPVDVRSALKQLKTKYNFKLSVSENQFVVDDAANVMRQYASAGLQPDHRPRLAVRRHGPAARAEVPEGLVRLGYGERRRSACRTSTPTRPPRTRAATSRATWRALLSKTKVIGVIGPIEVGDAKLYVDGFKAGALAANPEATVHVSYTGSFSDPSLMSKQASRVSRREGGRPDRQLAVGRRRDRRRQGQNNVAWFGTQWTQASLAPKQVVSSQVYDWTGMLTTDLHRHQGRQARWHPVTRIT